VKVPSIGLTDVAIMRAKNIGKAADARIVALAAARGEISELAE
jgi:hypothetical protein